MIRNFNCTRRKQKNKYINKKPMENIRRQLNPAETVLNNIKH